MTKSDIELLKHIAKVENNTFEIEYLKRELLAWEHKYNTVRPHQSLSYLAPLKFLEQQDYREEVRCH